MSKTVRIILAILVIILLVAIFVVSYILYRRTPAPKGCENIHPNEQKCHGCKETSCHFNLYYNQDEDKDEKIQNEHKEKENK